MGKFKNLYKRDLTNAQHFAFIHSFIQYAQAANFSSQRLLEALATLVTVFGRENDLYMIVRASEVIAQKEAADRRRDSFYTRLHRLVLCWAGSGMEVLDAAATELLKPFNLYKVKVNAQLDEETGQLLNLINDLSTPENLARLETINGTYLFNQLVAANNEVVALRLEQGVETSDKVKGALAAARRETDAAYDAVLAIIEGASLFADDPTLYEKCIKEWNGAIQNYLDMLERKSGGSSSSSQQGGTSNGNGTAPENGGGTNTGTEEGGQQGGSTPTPDPDAGFGGGGGLPPSGGGEVGDDNGGSSENGGTTPQPDDDAGFGGGGGLPGSGGEG